MTESGEHRRRYGDKEVGLILKRAAEIQSQGPESAAGGGLGLRELEEIATEAGIDPNSLRQAAAELRPASWADLRPFAIIERCTGNCRRKTSKDYLRRSSGRRGRMVRLAYREER
jgi:hypothetical protein